MLLIVVKKRGEQIKKKGKKIIVKTMVREWIELGTWVGGQKKLNNNGE